MTTLGCRISVMFSEVLREELRFLTFREAKVRLGPLRYHYLAFAIAATVLAGIGRYWDHPAALWWQAAGLGSLAYIGVLALIIWALVLPLKPQNWSFLGVFIFIGLTAPPAWLYAIPVERFMSFDAAAITNMWFLLIVAAWRVALYALFLKRVAKLKTSAQITCVLLPLALIVTALSIFNLEHAVFEIMGGIRAPTVADKAYFAVLALTFLSWSVVPFVGLWYLNEVWRARRT